MNSNEIYRKKFEELLEIEEKARNYYKYYVERITDPALLEKFQEIYSDEKRHVEIAKKFIMILA